MYPINREYIFHHTSSLGSILSAFFFYKSFINLCITFLIFVHREKQTSRNIAFRRWILHMKMVK